MAGERKLPAVGKVISGTHGYFWWNNDICYEVTSFEAKIKANGETIQFSGDMWENRKLMSVSGTWSAKVKKIYSRGQKYAEKLYGSAGKSKIHRTQNGQCSGCSGRSGYVRSS